MKSLSLDVSEILPCYTNTDRGPLRQVCVTPEPRCAWHFGLKAAPWSPHRPTELPERVSLLLYLPNGLMHFCWIFLGVFSKCHLFSAEKVYVLVQYMENT